MHAWQRCSSVVQSHVAAPQHLLCVTLGSKIIGQFRHSTSIRGALKQSRGYFETWLWFLLLDKILVYRVTRNAGTGVLRGTRAYGVLAHSASSALAPVSTSERHCNSLHSSISIQCT
jgi:hypothetical protein